MNETKYKMFDIYVEGNIVRFVKMGTKNQVTVFGVDEKKTLMVSSKST